MQFSIIPLTIETRGEIVTNNLAEFRELVREALGNINRDLTTDEEFGQAELDVKALKAAEESVRDAAIKSFDAQLKALVDSLNETAEEIRVPRLELEKLIASRKELVKTEIVEEFLAAFDIDPLDARRNYLAGLQNAIKGKRTLESMRKACEVFQATSQAVINTNRKSIATFEAAHGQDLAMDRRDLELKSGEYLTGELRRRFDAKKAADERKRLEDEAALAKAAEAKAKADLAASQKTVVKTVSSGSERIGSQPMPAMAPLPQPPPSNVTPMTTTEAVTLSEAEEWAEMTATVRAAFGTIKAHRERLIHDTNKQKIASFGASVNAVWTTLKAEVAS